jgi:hypothetical protein
VDHKLLTLQRNNKKQNFNSSANWLGCFLLT